MSYSIDKVGVSSVAAVAVSGSLGVRNLPFRSLRTVEPIPDIAFRREQDLDPDNAYGRMTPDFLNQGRYPNNGRGQQRPGGDGGVVDYEVFDLGVHGRNLPLPVRPFLYDRNGVVSSPRNVGRRVDAYA